MKVRGRTLCQTITGEPYQPVRIYYRVLKRGAMQGRLKRLKCIAAEGGDRRWNWSYIAEAREIAYEYPYSDIPKDYRPVPLGYFEWRSVEELHLNVFSFRGAVKALEFFDRKFNRHLAIPEKIRIVNRCFDESESVAPDRPHPSFDEFFERDDVAIPHPEELEERLLQAKAEYEDPEERSEAFDKILQEDSQLLSPEVEELLLHADEREWVAMLNVTLLAKHIEAMEHWKGNKRFNKQDAIDELLDMVGEF